MELAVHAPRTSERTLQQSGRDSVFEGDTGLLRLDIDPNVSILDERRAEPGGEPMVTACPICLKPLSEGSSVVYKGDELIHTSCWSEQWDAPSAPTTPAPASPEDLLSAPPG